jgi:hypothetical protein
MVLLENLVLLVELSSLIPPDYFKILPILVSKERSVVDAFLFYHLFGRLKAVFDDFLAINETNQKSGEPINAGIRSLLGRVSEWECGSYGASVG